MTVCSVFVAHEIISIKDELFETFKQRDKGVMENQEVQLTEDSLRRLSIISISLISSDYASFLMPMFAFLPNHRIDTVSPCCESKSNIFWGYQLLQLEHLNCFDFNLHGIGWNITKRAKRITF